MIELRITIIAVAYPSATAEPDNWYILKTDCGTCKGKMSWRPSEHDQLILEGEYKAWKGEREFAFSSARIDVPSNPRDQLHYAAIRTKGLGPAAEELIWQRHGDNWENAQEGDAPRLKGKVFSEFQLQIESLHGKSEEARVVAALIGKGCTPNMASAAWAMWKQQTLGVVNADCFRLAELDNYGFQDVDRRVRREYGIADDDKRRIRAAVIYSLRRLTDSGDTVVAWSDLFSKCCAMLGGYADLVSDCAGELFEENTLKGFAKSEGVSLAEDWKAESAIWEYVENVKEEKK
jgi:hypothetical protein